MVFKKDKKVELQGTKQIELPTFDPKPFIGKKIKVVDVQTYQNNEYKNYYVEFETEPVTMLKQADGTEKPLTIKKRAWLQQNNETGEVGWTKNTNLQTILNKYGKDHYMDMLGCEVIVQTEHRNDKERLTF